MILSIPLGVGANIACQNGHSFIAAAFIVSEIIMVIIDLIIVCRKEIYDAEHRR